MKIGILFSDNDFHVTVNSFLDLLNRGKDNHHNEGLTLEERYTKERIVELFNKSAGSIYWIFQNGFTYKTDWKNADKYLQIKEKNVFINDEVDKVKYEDHDGCFHFIEI